MFFKAVVSRGRYKAIKELGYQLLESATAQRVVFSGDGSERRFKRSGQFKFVLFSAGADGRFHVIHQ